MATPGKKPKRSKATKENPLWLHSSGQWCKKIKGKFCYFGADLAAALTQYEQEKASWQAGINPRTSRPASGAVTVGEVCNRYLAAQDDKMQVGELSPRTFDDQTRTCTRLIQQFGRNRAVSALRPTDFASLRAALANAYGPTRLGNEIVRTRTIFKWAFENELIESSIRYGSQFSKPKLDVMRRHHNAQPTKELTAAELRKAIDAAGQPMKAFVMLGINCGYGAADIAILPKSAINLDDGWIEHERAKTAVMRRCPLWPETIEAVREAMKDRPDPINADDDRLAFLTRFGRPWLRVGDTGAKNDEIGKGFAKLLESKGMKRPGVSFYVLRHLVQTVGEETLDLPAVAAIMGHTDQSMASHYRIAVNDERLNAVADHVRDWLFAKPKGAKSKPAVTGDDKPRLRIVG